MPAAFAGVLKDGLLLGSVEEGRFCPELYYLLNNLYLELLPVRRRPEDILYWVERYVKQFSERYKRYITLTAGARERLLRYAWRGNLTQITSFCECLVLIAPRRSTDENDVDRLFTQMYSITLPTEYPAQRVVYKDPEAARIAALLQRHGGSRGAVAAELGISTTTLWRKMKKHDIGSSFTV